MSHYIKKVVIDAVQWTGKNKEEIESFFKKQFKSDELYFKDDELFSQYLDYLDVRCVEKIELNDYVWYDLGIEYLDEDNFNRSYELYLD